MMTMLTATTRMSRMMIMMMMMMTTTMMMMVYICENTKTKKKWVKLEEKLRVNNIIVLLKLLRRPITGQRALNSRPQKTHHTDCQQTDRGIHRRSAELQVKINQTIYIYYTLCPIKNTPKEFSNIFYKTKPIVIK